MSDAPSPLASLLRTQSRVIFALMLRDIRTRFFGHGLGYLIMIAWPLSHIAILLSIFSLTQRTTPYGDNMVVFFATGVVPFIIFSYMSRFIMYSLVLNAPLLAFPAVKVLDILLARALLELLASALMTAIFIAILWLCNIDFWPRDPLEALYALGACALLGFGFGIINGVIAMAMRGWMMAYGLAIIVFYITSGILFVPDRLPTVAAELLAYNPVLQCIEWLRSAYYDDYGSFLMDKSYAIGCAVVATFSGLLLERLVRGRLLHN
jgi:capsular polysaccharide transport system permease protein